MDQILAGTPILTGIFFGFATAPASPPGGGRYCSSSLTSDRDAAATDRLDPGVVPRALMRRCC